MSITLALQNSLSGLVAAQAGLAVVSQNVANANTVGYSRQIAGLEAQIIAGRASGVRISGIERVVDEFLVGELQAQRSVLGAATAVEQFLTEIQARFGTPGSNTSLSADLAEFGVALNQGKLGNCPGSRWPSGWIGRTGRFCRFDGLNA